MEGRAKRMKRILGAFAVAFAVVVVLGLAPAVPAAAQTDDRVQAP